MSSSSSSTARELIALVRSIRFRAEDTGATVAVTDKGTVTATDREGRIVPGVAFRFMGEMRTHPRYGDQFAARTFVRHVPHDKAGVIRYLAETCPGVGRGIAARLWDRYGADAVTVLRERPAEVAGTGTLSPGLAAEAARILASEAGMESARIDLWSLFDGLGMGRMLIDVCLQRWGSAAADRIRANPWSLLLERLPGVGFRRADAVYQRLGGDKAALKRQTLLLWHLIDSDATGDTWIEQDAVARMLREEVGSTARTADAVRLGCRAGILAYCRSFLAMQWVTTAERAESELTLARSAVRLMEYVPAVPKVGDVEAAPAVDDRTSQEEVSFDVTDL